MKKIVSLILLLLLLTALVSGCKSKGNIEIDKSYTANEEEKSVEKNLEINENNKEKKEDTEIKEGIFPGDLAYDFSLLDREGNEINLSSLKGKVVFLNFWASWCPPCKLEMPHMQKIYEKYKDKDVVMLAVNITTSEEKGMEGVNSFLEENKYTFPVLYDKDGAVSEKYRVASIPTTYIIDKDGIILDLVTGTMDEKMMQSHIEEALK